jgi:hypothetical protein
LVRNCVRDGTEYSPRKFRRGVDLTGLLYRPFILASSFLLPFYFILSCFTLFFCFSALPAYKMDTQRNYVTLEETYDLLGYYAACSCNFLPTFWDNLSVPSSGVKNPKGLKSRIFYTTMLTSSVRVTHVPLSRPC